VVDLPEPVAPTTKMRPRLRIIKSRKTSGKPSVSKSGISVLMWRIHHAYFAALAKHIDAKAANILATNGEVTL